MVVFEGGGMVTSAENKKEDQDSLSQDSKRKKLDRNTVMDLSDKLLADSEKEHPP